ncbi:MAG: AbrB/MazE/SpoVT family DNA-binding domain-containing protein [Deltaproteobacteria bacterium]|nr:AbrB/MazE/SpoVT family DNA-binding domain-containing protein [Deltaproteobacteria bacterium]
MLAKKAIRNQIAIPSSAVNEILRADYFEVRLQGGNIVLKPMRYGAPTTKLGKVRAKMRQLGLTERDVTKAIRWARSR